MKLHPLDGTAELEPLGEQPYRVEYASADKGLQPIYLLADSQLLFWKNGDEPFLASVRGRLARRSPAAAYVGASNGDEPSFYSLFEAAMAEVGITERRMIKTTLEAEDLDFLDHADLVLLAGGDVERGWRAFEANGLKQILVRRYYEGALMMGISAGAVQLGLGGWGGESWSDGRFVDTFRMLPHLVGAHEEAADWAPLKAAVLRMGEHSRGYGMASGGGFIYHPDHSIEPVRRPLVEIRLRGQNLRQSLLLPGERTPDSDDGELVH